MFFFELTVRSHDPVVGMGFSDHGLPSNADFMITWLDSDGQRHVQVSGFVLSSDFIAPF